MLLVLDVGNTNTVLGVYENSAPGFAGKSYGPSPDGALARGHRNDAHRGRIRRSLPQPVCHWKS